MNLQNPVKAIRAKCLECGEGSPNEVKACPIERCPLYPFRLGKNPYRSTNHREKTPEEIQAMRDRMIALNAKRHDKGIVENDKTEG